MCRHKTIISASATAGVKRYIPPDFGTRSDLDWVAEKVPVVAMKKRVREFLQEQEGTGLTWTAICCGAFLDG